jgi:ribosome-binding protein aMBF1 (putative translation factor)
MNIEEYQHKLYRENPKLSLRDSMAEMVREARKNAGITQHDLAKRMKTKQESISRVEAGKVLPSLDFLYRFAEALSMKLKLPKLINNHEPTR